MVGFPSYFITFRQYWPKIVNTCLFHGAPCRQNIEVIKIYFYDVITNEVCCSSVSDRRAPNLLIYGEFTLSHCLLTPLLLNFTNRNHRILNKKSYAIYRKQYDPICENKTPKSRGMFLHCHYFSWYVCLYITWLCSDLSYSPTRYTLSSSQCHHPCNSIAFY